MIHKQKLLVIAAACLLSGFAHREAKATQLPMSIDLELDSINPRLLGTNRGDLDVRSHRFNSDNAVERAIIQNYARQSPCFTEFFENARRLEASLNQELANPQSELRRAVLQGLVQMGADSAKAVELVNTELAKLSRVRFVFSAVNATPNFPLESLEPVASNDRPVLANFRWTVGLDFSNRVSQQNLHYVSVMSTSGNSLLRHLRGTNLNVFAADISSSICTPSQSAVREQMLPILLEQIRLSQRATRGAAPAEAPPAPAGAGTAGR